MEPKKIFVSNISYKSTQKELREFFTKFGSVKAARILTERFRGRFVSRGIGFVEFREVAGFESAMKAYADAKGEGFEFAGRMLRVSQARVPRERKRDAAFIGGVPEGTTIDDIKAAFKDYNPVDAKIIRFNSEKLSGFAFVKFATPEEQEKAVKGTGKIQLKGAESIVRFSRQQYDFKRRVRRFHRRAQKQQQVNTK